MKVAHFDVEEKASDPAQGRVPQVAMQERHRARSYAALKAIAHDEIGAFAQFVEEWLQRRKIIRIIGIAHDDVSAAGRANSTDQCGTVSLALDIDNPCAFFLR